MSSARPGRELTEHTVSTGRHTTGYIASRLLKNPTFDVRAG
jgi:hypothetical protein